MGTEMSPCCGGDNGNDRYMNTEIEKQRMRQSNGNEAINKKPDTHKIEEVVQYGIQPEFEKLLVNNTIIFCIVIITINLHKSCT